MSLMCSRYTSPRAHCSIIVLLKEKPMLVGFSAMTGVQIKYALEATRLVKENSDVPTVWGGVHPSLLPEQTLENQYIDFVVIGEGETRLLKLVGALKNRTSYDNIDGLGYKKEGRVIVNLQKEFVDLDKMPDTPYHLVNIEDYIQTASFASGTSARSIDFHTSRGCPHRCSFCYNQEFNKRRWRGESAERVSGKIKRLVKDYKITALDIEDDEFFVDMERAKKICRLLAEENISVEMFSNCRVNYAAERMDGGLLALLKKSGFHTLAFGVESGSPRMQQLMCKDISNEHVFETIKKLKGIGIGSKYYFMAGMPRETLKDLHATTDLIQKMNQITKHRGSDDAGIFLDNFISLGHNRLSIIDISSSGHQPMTSGDKNLVIVFNGEIYNFKELRKELEDKGHKFFSQSDTEVILKSYQEYGENCLNKFNGIFAFAIWDKQKKELFLARDHIGIKPLYYFWDGKNFIFSSEIKGILAHNIPRGIDLDSLNLYFSLSYVPQPLTIFKNIEKLPPAHWLKFKNGKIEIKKYWEIKDRSNFDTKEEAIGEIRRTLEDSVKGQIISDRPVGVFLSGGVDSSVILGLVRKFAPNITKTYTTGFKVDVQKEKFNADFKLARKTSEYYGTEHHELMIGLEDVCDNLEKIAWHMDEPNGNHTAVAIFLLSQMAKKDVAVVLGGDGGDELFGGYPRYIFSRLISRYQKLPGFSRKFFQLLLKILEKEKYSEKLERKGAARIADFMATKSELLSAILKPQISNSMLTEKYFSGIFSQYDDDITRPDFEKIFMDIDRKTWLIDDSLMRTDKMSMAHALESRVPILDKRLVEISQKISTSWKIKSKEGKIIFREAFKDYILPHLQNKPKMGWFTPMAKWLRQEPLKSKAGDILNSLPDEYFKKDEILKIFNDHLSGKVYNLNILWYLISFGVWHNLFIKNRQP